MKTIPTATMDASSFLAFMFSILLSTKTEAFPNTTVAIWPMSANYSAMNVQQNFHGRISQVTFNDGPTGYAQTATGFAGIMGEYVSYTDEASVLDVGLGSFTAATHIWSTSREGLILTWSGLKAFPNGMKIYIFQESLHVDLYSRDRGMEYGQLKKTFTFLRVPQQQWNLIGASFDRTTNTISLIVNDLKRDIHLPPDFNFGVSGIETRGGIYFGGHPKLNPRPIQGKMACSMLFKDILSLEDLQKASAQCMELLTGTVGTAMPVGIWPLDVDYGASDLSGYNLHGDMQKYVYVDGPDNRKDGATQLGDVNAGSIDIVNMYSTLTFKHEMTFFMHVYFDQMQDCELNAWHESTINVIDSGPQLVIRDGTLNVKLDPTRYVTDVCLSFAHNTSTSTANIGNSSAVYSNCNDRLHVKVHTWHHIGFTYNDTDGVFTLWVDRIAVMYKTGRIEPPKGIPGILRLGGSGFLGRMSWVYLVKKAISVPEAIKMHDDTFRALVLMSKPFEPVGFWPLDGNQGIGFLDRSRFRIPAKVTGYTLVKGPGFVENTAAHLTGSTTSYMQIVNRNDTLDFEKTVSVFAWIKMTKNKDSRIVQWAGGPNMTSGIHLSIMNNYVTVELLARGGLFKTNMYQGFLVEYNVWTFIGFTYDAKDGLLLIWKDDAHPVIKNVGEFLLETRGDVFVGGRPDGINTVYNFEGDIACVSIYGAMMNKYDVMFVKRNCQQRMYLMDSPVALYPLTKDYLAADVAGYGNNGNPQNLGYATGPDNSPDRASLFTNQQQSRVEIINYDRQLDLNKQITIIAYISPDPVSSVNATIMEFDGMEYSAKGLGLLIQNSHLTASIYPKQYTLNSVQLEAGKWYTIGMTYHYYHSMLTLWVQRYGEDGKAFLAETKVSPQLLATRGKLILGASSWLLDKTYSGRMACFMVYDRVLGMEHGLEEAKKCFNDYMTTVTTAAPTVPTTNGNGVIYHPESGTGTGTGTGTGHPSDHSNTSRRVLMPILIVIGIGALIVVIVIFVSRKRKRQPRRRMVLDATKPRQQRFQRRSWRRKPPKGFI